MNRFEFNINRTGIKYGSERHLLDTPVIVLNGHVYHLIVDINPDANNICKRCALQPLCFEETNESLLRKLCNSCTPNGAGYWVEDRYPVQYTLEVISENQNYPGYDHQVSCRTFDRPMFIGFEKET